MPFECNLNFKDTSIFKMHNYDHAVGSTVGEITSKFGQTKRLAPSAESFALSCKIFQYLSTHVTHSKLHDFFSCKTKCQTKLP